ncbi:ATP-dependent Clp protease ATP-binding subunit ClpX [Operophtera brumata]|uniref:ATP-dependent Clp protease ATP-binding subunit ClpX n=1 Tax=Operophtera brumata TaxID=104452 RepID=A0A0L7LSZ8_OPEBR|nr:ATP-dependent Clp protease ATP-binding subunit ClpX [Operophtera brumata]
MKMNISLMKLTIRLLILLIFFVMIFLISALLYSSRYWPDVYNYINANITIKHIPTLSELNLTVLEVDWTTELYTTVEDYDSSTVEGFDFDIDEFTNIQGDFEKPKRPKRNAKIEKFENDYNELPRRSVVVDYLFLEETTGVDDGVVWKKIVKDLIDESKLVPKNLGEIEMVNRSNGAKLLKLVSSYCFPKHT